MPHMYHMLAVWEVVMQLMMAKVLALLGWRTVFLDWLHHACYCRWLCILLKVVGLVRWWFLCFVLLSSFVLLLTVACVAAIFIDGGAGYALPLLQDC